MKNITKAQAKATLESLSKILNHKVENETRLKASSKFGDITIFIDLTDSVPSICTRLIDVKPNTECIERGFGEFSGKRNYHHFVQDLGSLLENFERDVIRDEIKIIGENNEK